MKPPALCRKSAADRVAIRQVRGFTLIEVLVVLAIVAVLGGAIVACVAGGIRVWDAARRFVTNESQALVGFELMQRDIMNMTVYGGYDVEGAARALTFPSVLSDPPVWDTPDLLLNALAYDVPGFRVVEYSFSEANGTLSRKVKELLANDEFGPAQEEVLCSGLSSVRFRYGSGSSAETPAKWDTSWRNATNLPVGISIELEFSSEEEGSTETFARTFYLAAVPRTVPGGEQ